MKTTILSHRKMVLLALASVALITPALHAQTNITPSLDDLVLGFYSTGPGQTADLEVDLGNMSNFYYATGSFALPALAVQDLVNIFGASWYTSTNLYWGAISTTGRATGTADGHAPVGTLWASGPDGQTAFNRGSVFAQKAASPNIEAMIVEGAAGSLYGTTSTSNSTTAAVIQGTLAGSWTYQDLKTDGTSFSYFNPTVDNTGDIPQGNQIVSALYELQPSTNSVPATVLGYLVLSHTGLSFQPTVAVTTPIASFSASPTNGAPPLTVTFTDTSTGTIVGQGWTFGDGGISSASSPSYTYSNAGVYSVSLQVTGPGGSNTFTLNNLITVYTPQQAWRAGYGLPVNGTGIGSEVSALAGDGIANLIKYALGINPFISGYQGHYSTGTTNITGQNYLTLTYTRTNPPPADLTYSVEVSTNLTTAWIANQTTVLSIVTNGNGTATVKVSDQYPMSDYTKRFIHLRIISSD